jgi:TrmH family RNA methyltransferase
VNPKVLRGSMGSAFRFPAVPAGEADLLDWASARGAALWVTSAAGEPLRRDAVRAAGAVLMVVGNEGAGVGSSLASRAARRVAIPIRSGAESLNVAVASGILLYEALRDG